MFKNRKKILSFVLLLTTFFLITGCGKSDSSSESADKDGKRTIKILSIWGENESQGQELKKMTEDYIASLDDKNVDYEYEVVSISNLNTKIATLLAADDLPDIFAYDGGVPLQELIKNKSIVNISEKLKKLGKEDYILDSASSVLTNLTDTKDLYDLPLGMNIEGFWYNKELFKKAGVEVPTTWDEFMTVCEQLKDKGIQPLAVAGGDKWPATRLVNAYIFRSMGVDAVGKATSGEMKFTDEGFVNAAKMISDMAQKGYFGVGSNTVDSSTAVSMVLGGQAAMEYNGSWITSDILGDDNPAGADGIGYFNVPVVDEKISPMTETSINCGNVLCLSSKTYDDVVEGWLDYFVSHVGDFAIKDMGTVVGYKYDDSVEVDPVIDLVNDTIANTTKGALWFEATMNNEIKSVATDNIQSLLTGDMTAEEYMKSIQDVNQ